jgi:hypothetical protein
MMYMKRAGQCGHAPLLTDRRRGVWPRAQKQLASLLPFRSLSLLYIRYNVYLFIKIDPEDSYYMYFKNKNIRKNQCLPIGRVNARETTGV